MSIEPIPAPKVVNEYIRSGMTELLHVNDIYPLASHGWVDENTADPDEIGHAMWQSDSLLPLLPAWVSIADGDVTHGMRYEASLLALLVGQLQQSWRKLFDRHA